ncbi:MAG: transglutaminase family protein [Alphaproteobacteria bacterium]|nr:transglutaminase family protein [Alphaproteobacteria bacterium]
MPIFTIRHVTTYSYKRTVGFGEHRLMLRPRDDSDQRVVDAKLDITPAPAGMTWTQDAFGNHVGTAHFAERAKELRFDSTVRLEHKPSAFTADAIDRHARTFPFAYTDEDRRHLTPFIAPSRRDAKLDAWTAQFLRQDGTADTHDLLTRLTQTIHRAFKHVGRHEKGIQSPDQTLKLASGSCRDLAVLMIDALGSLGLTARFVSGYLNILGDDENRTTGGNTHAWVQVYVPGAGWIDFDPSSGSTGNENLVRVAVVSSAREAIPLQGTWIGTAADHLAMKVAVKVTPATS